MDSNLNNPEVLRELVKSQVHRNIINLSVNYLKIVEDLRDLHGYVIPNDLFQNIRKKVLDGGNSVSRQIQGDLDKFDLLLK